MTYDSLLKNVLLAQRRNEHRTYPDAERKLITYLLSQFREGIQENRFPGVIRVSREVEVAEIQFNYQYICIFTKHRHGAAVKAIHHNQGRQIDIRMVVNSLETLGLKCEVVKRSNYLEKMLVRVPLEAKTETP